MTVTSGAAVGLEPTVTRGENLPYFVRVDEAAAITGLPVSLIRKCFIAEKKRPKNVPAPPPHKRIGKAIYIIRDQLPAWAEALGDDSGAPEAARPRYSRRDIEGRIVKQPANDNVVQGNLASVKRTARKTRS
jgi:hypothetical protein